MPTRASAAASRAGGARHARRVCVLMIAPAAESVVPTACACARLAGGGRRVRTQHAPQPTCPLGICPPSSCCCSRMRSQPSRSVDRTGYATRRRAHVDARSGGRDLAATCAHARPIAMGTASAARRFRVNVNASLTVPVRRASERLRARVAVTGTAVAAQMDVCATVGGRAPTVSTRFVCRRLLGAWLASAKDAASLGAASAKDWTALPHAFPTRCVCTRATTTATVMLRWARAYARTAGVANGANSVRVLVVARRTGGAT